MKRPADPKASPTTSLRPPSTTTRISAPVACPPRVPTPASAWCRMRREASLAAEVVGALPAPYPLPTRVSTWTGGRVSVGTMSAKVRPPMTKTVKASPSLSASSTWWPPGARRRPIQQRTRGLLPASVNRTIPAPLAWPPLTARGLRSGRARPAEELGTVTSRSPRTT